MTQSTTTAVAEAPKKRPRASFAAMQARIDALEAELAAAREREAATAEVLQIINSSPGDLRSVFDAILRQATRLCAATFGVLNTYDGSRFETIAALSVPAAYAAYRAESPHSCGPGTFPRRILDGEAVIHIADLMKEDTYRGGDPGRRALVDLGGARSALVVALIKDAAPCGFINIYRNKVRPFTARQISLLQNFAAQAVIAMENARLLTETREALEQQTATAEVLGVINASPGNLAPVFDAILEKAHSLCGSGHGTLFLRDGDHFRPAAMRGVPEPIAERLRGGLPGRDIPIFQPLLAGERYVHVIDTALFDHPMLRLAQQNGVRTLLAVPLRKGGELLGTIVAARFEAPPFSDKQIALLENFAAQAVIAIENARLLTETREALDQQTATAEVLGVINAAPGNLAPVFDAMLEKALRLCEASFGNLSRIEGDNFYAIAVHGVPAEFAAAMRQPRPMVPGNAHYRLAHGEDVVQVFDVSAEDVYHAGIPARRLLADIAGARTTLWVALRKEQKALGAFVVYRREVRPFTDKQIALLQNFAAQAVIAMENARLLTETREALEQQTATAEVLQVINASPGDLQPVFAVMLEKAMNLCDATFGVLLMYDGEAFHTAAGYGIPEAYAEFLRQPFRAAPGNTVYRIINGEDVVRIADLRDDDTTRLGDPTRRASVEKGGIRSGLMIALRKDNTLLGTITAYRQEVRPFTDKQIALLQNFAAQAVIAMENARLLTETREALEQQTATAEVLGVINSSPGDLAPVFDAILQKALKLCDAAFGHFRTYDGERFPLVAVRGDQRFVEVMSQRAALVPGPHHPLARIIAGEDINHIVDAANSDAYRNDPRFRELVDTGVCRSLLGVALRKDKILIGYVVVYRQDVRPFADKQIALLRNFAAQAVIAMENARLLTETREALERQTATAEVLGVINSSPGDLASVFDAILEKAHSLCGIGSGTLQLYDGEQKFHAEAVHGLPEELAHFLRQGYHSGPNLPQTRLIAGDAQAHVTDLAEVDDPGARTAVELGNIRTIVCVALRRDSILLGFISAARFEVHPFSEKEIAILEGFAAQAVIAIENARLLGELRQSTEAVAELNRGLEARVAQQVEELGRVGRLKRFLAPQLAEMIVSQGDERILESHRREIVVVFCDLRGYTAFTETAEPEEVLDFLREYHGALGPLVSRFEGTLDQFSGDGIMVFFNDPVPIADPAERAVRMAVAMREAAGALVADWRERGRELGFGVGIAQGYATLGQIGFSERSGYTAIGTVCNVAARLCGEAKDGQILLSQRVNVALKGSLATEPVGALALKGLTQPVVAYNVPLAAGPAALRVIEGGPAKA